MPLRRISEQEQNILEHSILLPVVLIKFGIASGKIPREHFNKIIPLSVLYSTRAYATGVGYAICLLDVYVGMHYNTIIGWAVYYLMASFQYELPWTSCNNEWNTPNCRPVTMLTPNMNATSPAREFFE